MTSKYNWWSIVSVFWDHKVVVTWNADRHKYQQLTRCYTRAFHIAVITQMLLENERTNIYEVSYLHELFINAKWFRELAVVNNDSEKKLTISSWWGKLRRSSSDLRCDKEIKWFKFVQLPDSFRSILSGVIALLTSHP